MSDLISRQAAIMHFVKASKKYECGMFDLEEATHELWKVPSAKPEIMKLTDKEQRIFLAAMAREEKVCEEVDRNYTREPYEDSLVSICREIERKVKGALWGI